MKKTLIYGSLEFGKIVKNLATHCGLSFSGFVDDYNCGEDVVGSFDFVLKTFSPNDHDIVIAIGYNNLEARWRVFEKVISHGYTVPRLIHPHAYVDQTSSIGDGSIVMASSVIDFNSTIGQLSVIWPGVVVNHDSTIGQNTFLSPNCTICGSVNIGESTFIGAGSTVVDHTNVSPHSFIKAGSTFYHKRAK